MNGIELITAERQRQISKEGWSPEHDDLHKRGELADAASGYTIYAVLQVCGAPLSATQPPQYWPWDPKWWKPSCDPVRNLVKAGALIAAEIDRIQRRSAKPTEEEKK